MYRDYYISSLKIEFRPTNLYGGGNAFRIDSLTCGTSMDTILGTPMLPGSFNAALDAKMFDVQKPLKRNDKTDWEEIKENAKKGNLDAVPADVYVRHYHTLRAIAKDHARIEARTSPKSCFWVWGKPGTGKTRAATLTYPNAYRKLLNKWWDGY